MVRFLDPEIVEKGDKSLILKNLNSSVVSLAQLGSPSVALPAQLVMDYAAILTVLKCSFRFSVEQLVSCLNFILFRERLQNSFS